MTAHSSPAGNAQRDFAVEVVRQLRGAGHEALWAGGCVRDQLLGARPKDYDVATSALPEEVRQVFGRRRTIAVGAAFGVITVLGPKKAGQIEVATFRADAGYSDGRRPDAVEFTNAKNDASRRDFTINGLFFDPIEEKLIDYVGGQADIQAKIVRAIGVATDRFDEDKLRMLRAIRFAATLDFEVHPDTAAAIEPQAEQIVIVSAERIGMELRRMLLDTHCGRAIKLLAVHELLPHVLPELREADEADFDRFGHSHQRTAPWTLPVAMACLLAPWATGQEIGRRATQLKFTRKESDLARWLHERHAELTSADLKPWSAVQPLLAHAGGEQLVAVYEALSGVDSASEFCREKLALPAEQLDPPPLLTGDDLVRHGLRPGPEFAGKLQRARDAQLDGQISTLEEALSLIDRETA